MTRREQTKAIKTVLLESGHPVVSVKHGTGTARSWIHIKLNVEWRALNALAGEVERLAAETIGRDTWTHDTCIQVYC